MRERGGEGGLRETPSSCGENQDELAQESGPEGPSDAGSTFLGARQRRLPSPDTGTGGPWI